jgi:hypothetical protein
VKAPRSQRRERSEICWPATDFGSLSVLTITNLRRWIEHRKRREAFEIGIGTRRPAKAQDYQVSLVLNSTINMTFNLAPMA